MSADMPDSPIPPAVRPASKGFPAKQGLYDPAYEKDACGIGFIAHLKGQPSHAIVADALEMLHRMDHRGACGCEKNTGDGAGILTGLPHELLAKVALRDAKLQLPRAGDYAAGIIFLPVEIQAQTFCINLYEQCLAKANLPLIGWRDMPIDPDGADIGPSARASMPTIKQLFVERPDGLDQDAFERKLYVVRNQVINLTLAQPDLIPAGSFYVCSLSCRIIVYKGQLTSGQVPLFYPDLRDPDFVSHLAMVHSRFSTNTFPSWDRAQPCRMMSHNGEINTVQGNKNWIRARQGLMKSSHFSERELAELFPIVNPETSDSGSMDNVLEMLYMSGRTLPEVVTMMVPEAWENHESMPVNKTAFYEYHANLMEPWDGPASIGFTDGKVIGATLDRNGLRPSRYYVTNDDRVIMASEVGVVDVPPQNVVKKGRLQPGRMFLVNFEEGRIVADDEVKNTIANARPYGEWLNENRLTLADLPAAAQGSGTSVPASENTDLDPDTRLALLQSFGYTVEHLNMLLLPMVNAGSKSKEALGSMGNDAALAVLSDKPRLLYDYFKQLFAQVTNPPIDPLRETIIMSLATSIGPEGNVLDTTPQQCRRLRLEQPILTDQEIASIKALDGSDASHGWRTQTIDITYDKPDTAGLNGEADAAEGAALKAALDRICDEATDAITAGYHLVVLSDRKAGPGRIALPSLLAVGTVHHHLVRNESRTKLGVVLESGEAREVHHFCTLAGYGCDAVNPYLAYQAMFSLRDAAVLDPELTSEQIVQTYISSAAAGIKKVMSKMGISTLASYKGAQIFECVGLRDEVIARSFAGTASRLQGVNWNVLAKEGRRRHEIGFPPRPRNPNTKNQLPNPGEYHWRPEGEAHAFSPRSIANLQIAARTNSHAAYDDYAKLCNDDAKQRCTLRGLLSFVDDPAKSIPLDDVEPAKDIVKRFRTGAMSLGSLSREAHETLALAMNRIGGYSNSGEGGEDPVRFSLEQYDDGSPKTKRSAIKQVASGRFGVTSYYLANADTLQIKIAQGAKPGEGGQLPGFKVDPYIASIRHSTPGVGLISPPPHHDIYSIEDLSQLIYDLKRSNPSAKVSVKLVAEVGVGTVAAGVAKAKADHILISGHDGGTGASPLTSIKHAGLPWELGLAETHQTLVLNDLRSRVRLETDGGFKTGRDVVIAGCLGAEEYGFSTAPLVTIGCIMMRKCHLNTCPVGICTQDKDLRKKFNGTPEHVINYLFLVAEEARQFMAKIGVRTIDELIGRVDLLKTRDAIDHWKADGLDLTPILRPANKPYPQVGVRKLIPQEHEVELHFDNQLIAEAKHTLANATPIVIDKPVINLNRAVGTMLSHEVSKKYLGEGLPDDTITLNLTGSAGQSLGAWLAPGITINLVGDANDYVGKGLSGGKISIQPDPKSPFLAEENVILGNVALYGATDGDAYFRGIAAERFAVRNSGARAVVEGVGDHGCEYMTGGRVVVLGATGRNFAAGMSGGIAYIWDPDDVFSLHCNLGMVELEALEDDADIAELVVMITSHMEATGSPVAKRILDDWDHQVGKFRKVMPIDYRRVLMQQKAKAKAEAVEPEVGHG